MRLAWAAVRIEQLEYIAGVGRLGSFRRAAEALHISQPALSESVRSLERKLGVDLLERGGHGARVSRTGRDLLHRIFAVLDSVDRLRQAAGEMHRIFRARARDYTDQRSGSVSTP
jgi:DNA-binding transcriptional LysR family regulator